MAKTLTIEKTLMKACKLRPRKGDSDRQSLLKRITEAANDLAEAAWEGLPENAQGWVNGAVKRLKKDKPIGDFPDGEVSDGAPEPTPDQEPEGEPPAEKKDKKEKGGKKDKSDKKEKKDKSDGPSHPRGYSGQAYRRLMLTNPDLDKDAILDLCNAQLEKDGAKQLTANSAYICYYEARNTIDALRELGLYDHPAGKPKEVASTKKDKKGKKDKK